MSDDIEVLETPPAGLPEPAAEPEETDLLKAALAADAAAEPVDGGEEPAPAPTQVADRSAQRIAKAAAAEEARVERRAARVRLEEAEGLLEQARARAASIERAAEARLKAAEELETEHARARRLVAEGGLEGLEALGYTYESLAEAEIARHDPQILAKRALEEVATLKRELAERAEREAAIAAREREQRLEAAIREDRMALVAFAESAAEVSPTVANLARAARSDGRAARLLIEAADEVKNAYVEQAGRLPYMHEVVAELDARLRFFQTSSGTGQAQAPVPSQAARPTHQRTLGSPAAVARPTAARRELSPAELEEQHAALLREALMADRAGR
jgi:hypothetical protein